MKLILMTEFMKSIESNYGKIIAEPDPEPLVLDEALKRNIRITVGKLTNLEVSRVAHLPAKDLPDAAVKRLQVSAPNLDEPSALRSTDSKLIFEVDKSAHLGDSNVPNPMPRSSNLKSPVGRQFNFKLSKPVAPAAVTETRASHSNRSRSVKSIDLSQDLKAARKSRSKSRAKKITTDTNIRNPLSTINEVNTIKPDDPKEAAKKKNQADTSLDLKSKYKSPTLAFKHLTNSRDHGESRSKQSLLPSKDENPRPPAKKLINLADFKKSQMTPTKAVLSQQEIKDKGHENPKKTDPAANPAGARVKPGSKKTTVAKIISEVHEIERMSERPAKGVSSTSRILMKRETRPMSAFAEIRGKDNPRGSHLLDKKGKQTKEVQIERSKTPNSKLVKNRIVDQVDKPKPLMVDSNLFMQKLKDPQIKVYRVGEYRRDRVHKRNSSKPVYLSKGPEGEIQPIVWNHKINDAPRSKLLSSKITSKATDYGFSKSESQFKGRPSSKYTTQISPGAAKQEETPMSLFSRAEAIQSTQSHCKSTPDYCLLNLLYGVFSVANLTDLNGVAIRQPIRYKVGEGNNGRLVESLIRQKSHVEAEYLNSKANIQWSQINHKKLVTSSIRLIPRLQYKDLSLRQELAAFTLADPKILTEELQNSGVFIVENPQIVKSLFAANLKLNQVSYIVSEGLNMVNHLHGISSISHKTKLTESIIKYAKSRGIDPFSIIPKTYLIRMGTFESDIERVILAKRKEDGFKNPLIVKPGENSNRGCGIAMAYSLEEMVQTSLNILRSRKGTNCVIVQNYITNPLLYKKRKFDIRCYGLAVRFSGRTLFFWYSDGYARTSSFEFSVENKKNLMVHLTNEAVQVQGNKI